MKRKSKARSGNRVAVPRIMMIRLFIWFVLLVHLDFVDGKTCFVVVAGGGRACLFEIGVLEVECKSHLLAHRGMWE